MVVFRQNIVIIGCGSVAQCTLPLLLKLIDISPKSITIIDFTDRRSAIAPYLEQGVCYKQKRISPENYTQVLSEHLKQGDLLIDLAWNLDTVTLIDWCQEKGVLYINTSVEVWNPFENYSERDPRELTLYHRQMTLKERNRVWKQQSGATAIVDHGANPGLVSHFTKQGLIDIAEKLLNAPLDPKRKVRIQQLMEESNFSHLAKEVGVKTIHISERDTQVTSNPKKVNEFVNTWSVEGLIEEGLAPAEIGWGTHERYLPDGTLEHRKGPRNQICLARKGINTWVRSWVPSGPIKGMVIRHGEAFGISQFLTVMEGSEVIYRPTVHYAYCPSDSTINSLHELSMRAYEPQPLKRILLDEIISGHDELGCLLMGHDLQAWWIGSVLDIEEARRLVPGQNATTVQVAIAVVAAALYAIRHPSKGFCLPDDLDYKEILKVAKPYLGRFVSQQVDWSPLNKAKAFQEFKCNLPQKEDEWQFITFMV